MAGREKGLSRLKELELVDDTVLLIQFELQPELLDSSSKLRGRFGAKMLSRVALKGRPETSIEPNRMQDTTLRRVSTTTLNFCRALTMLKQLIQPASDEACSSLPFSRNIA
jgi:hypothetical protein